MYPSEKPMCNDDQYGDVPNSKEIYVRGLAGELIRTTVFDDGSTIYHHGGPAGDAKYDQFGEEC